MPEIKDVVVVNITKETASIKSASFGVPMIVGANATFAERAKYYTSASAVAADMTGTTTSTEYKMAVAIFSQSPAPAGIWVGRTDLTGEGFEDTDMTDALTTINFEQKDWYMFCITSRTKAEQVLAAAWAGSNSKFFVVASGDTDIGSVAPGSDSTTLAAVLKAAAYEKILGVYHTDAATEYPDAAAIGKMCVKFPGSYTFKFKTLTGVTVDSVTDTYRSNIKAKNFSTYEEIGGKNMLAEGKSPDGSFADMNIFIDWLRARVGEAVFGLLAKVDKVSFDDSGINTIKSVLVPVFDTAQKRGAISPEAFDENDIQIGGYVITMPSFQSISTADKTERFLDNVEFTCWYGNAIHNVQINGRVTL
jgi:hypothetical protein